MENSRRTKRNVRCGEFVTKKFMRTQEYSSLLVFVASRHLLHSLWIYETPRMRLQMPEHVATRARSSERDERSERSGGVCTRILAEGESREFLSRESRRLAGRNSYRRLANSRVFIGNLSSRNSGVSASLELTRALVGQGGNKFWPARAWYSAPTDACNMSIGTTSCFRRLLH